MIRLEKKNGDMISTEKQQKLTSRKINKYEFLTGKGILPSDQGRIIEVYIFSFRKIFRKTNKNDWRSRRKTNKSNWK